MQVEHDGELVVYDLADSKVIWRNNVTLEAEEKYMMSSSGDFGTYKNNG